MKIKAPVMQEFEVKWVRLDVKVQDEHLPSDFPGRRGDLWTAIIDIESGNIKDWPEGLEFDLHLKVRDSGSYALLNGESFTIAEIQNDYVPNCVIPGSYGDYIEMRINEFGCIENWPPNPDFSEFFQTDEFEVTVVK